MGFKLAELFVDITTRGVKFSQQQIDGVKKGLEKVIPVYEQIRVLSAAFLATVAGLGTVAAREYASAEEAASAFAVALANIGENTQANIDTYSEFANELQAMTVYEDDALIGMMTNALKLGVALKDLKTVTKGGIGLGEMYFNGDAAAGIEALALAQQGNIRALQKMIPELKSATSKQEALDIIMRKSEQGLAFATARANTFSGSMARMRVAIGNSAEGFGKLLIPYLQSAANSVQRLSMLIDGLTESQKKLVLQITAVSTGLAAVVTFGPTLYNFFKNIGLGAIGFAQAIAKSFLFVVTNPVSWMIAGLAAVATGIAYLGGTGDTAAERIVSGFGLIGEGLDTLFGSLEGFVSGMKTIWIAATDFITDIWWSAFDKMNLVWENLRTGAKTTVAIIKDYYEALTDNIANLMAKVAVNQTAENKIRADFARKKPNASEDEIRQALNKEFKINNDYIDRQTSYQKQAREKAYNDRLIEIDNEHETRMKYSKKQIEDQRKLDHEAAQRAMDEQLDKFGKSPKLSENIGALMEKIKKGLGIDKVKKELEDIFAKFQKLQTKPADFGSDSLKLEDRSPPADLKYTSLADAFKHSLAAAIIGGDLKDAERAEAKRHREESIKLQRESAKHLREMNEAIQSGALSRDGGMA